MKKYLGWLIGGVVVLFAVMKYKTELTEWFKKMTCK